MNLQDFEGVWHSHYNYESTIRGGQFSSEHYLKATVSGNELVFETIPEHNEAHMNIRLNFESDFAMGSWRETTNPNGLYKGEQYVGVIQLMVSEDKKRMEGVFVTLSRKGGLQTGPWVLTYVGPELTEPIKPLVNDEPVDR